MDAPDLYRYTDYRRYLRDWLSYKGYSLADFAVRIKCHRSQVGNILTAGRRLRPPYLERVVEQLELDADERQVFVNLVGYEDAEFARDRNEHWKKLLVHRRFHDSHRIEANSYHYLSNWYIPAIRELCICESLTEDPVYIAARLRPAISPAEARMALQLLLSMKLVEKDCDGILRVTQTGLVTEDRVEKLSIRNFYREVLGLAVSAIDDVPSKERQFQALIQAVPAGMLQQVRSEVESCRKRVQALCDDELLKNPGCSSSLYLLSLQFFPISRRPE